ncbi:MAG: hypothetical protein RIQ81_319 [Pseudomonadota bacterium]|jgi:Xaa-Pro aminopeptidase
MDDPAIVSQEAIEASRHDDLARRLGAVREKTWKALDAIARRIQPGMSELEAVKLAQATLAEMGSRKFWHKCHVRFGPGTAAGFDDPYENHQLTSDDIFYIDIGPVWDGIEGDAAATYVVGSNPELIRCRDDARKIFDETRYHWQENGVTGQELYRFATARAEMRGWVLAPDYVRGHRLSEFPHSFHSKMALEQAEFSPTPDRWVLEIQICHRDMKFGAYYEDILN